MSRKKGVIENKSLLFWQLGTIGLYLHRFMHKRKMKKLFFVLAFIVASVSVNAQDVLGFKFGMTQEQAAAVSVDCDSIMIDQEANTFLFLDVERNGIDYDLLIVQFDDDDKISTIMLGAEVESIDEGAELQQLIIGNNKVVESENDEDLAGAKVYFVDETGDEEPEYILSIIRDEEDQSLSVVATYPSAWD